MISVLASDKRTFRSHSNGKSYCFRFRLISQIVFPLSRFNDFSFDIYQNILERDRHQGARRHSLDEKQKNNVLKSSRNNHVELSIAASRKKKKEEKNNKTCTLIKSTSQLFVSRELSRKDIIAPNVKVDWTRGRKDLRSFPTSAIRYFFYRPMFNKKKKTY